MFLMFGIDKYILYWILLFLQSLAYISFLLSTRFDWKKKPRGASKAKTTQTKDITQKYIVCIQTSLDKKRAEQHTSFMLGIACNNI